MMVSALKVIYSVFIIHMNADARAPSCAFKKGNIPVIEIHWNIIKSD